MKEKTLLCLALVTSMLLSVFMVGSVGAQSTTIGVEPSPILDTSLVKDSTFTVEIWIRNVENLAAYQFKLGYNTAVLTATEIGYGGVFPSYMELGKEIHDAEGWLSYAVMVGIGEPPFTGDGCAAIIYFTVDSLGDSALNLYETKVGAPPDPQDPTTPVPIPHDALDGYFNNVPPPSVTLARHSAWPEHHHYSSGDEDTSNDLFAIAYNDGTEDTYVKVVFTVTRDGTGTPIGDFETQTVALLVGAMYGNKGDARLWATFTPPSAGKYYASARCWADTNLDTIPDKPMGKVKDFSFSVP